MSIAVLFAVVEMKKYSLNFTTVGKKKDSQILSADLDSEEDNRNEMKDVLKKMRVMLLEKFKKNKKKRSTKG